MRFRVRLVGEDVPDIVNAMVAVVAVEGRPSRCTSERSRNGQRPPQPG